MTRSPFVRWPEHHVYARDHGDRVGLGTYDHRPVPLTVEELGDSAERLWLETFDEAVRQALLLLPVSQRFTVDTRLNGVFSMTADNRPLLGPAANTPGLWLAEAIWVTHAAGAARSLVQMMTQPGGNPIVEGLEALSPDRFAGQDDHDLRDRALRMYRDIYATA